MRLPGIFRSSPVLIALTLIASAGCGPDDAVQLPVVPLGEPFEIAEGATVRLGPEGPALLFDAVEADSRCPVEARCIQAGEARVRFLLGPELSEPKTGTLMIPGLAPTPYAEGTGVVVDDYRVRLLALEPAPAPPSPVTEAAETRALLVVERE